MALGFFFGVALLLSVWSTAKCQIPNEVLNMECRDRFFMIAVDLSFAGNEPHFEAVDKTGVYPISEQYAATCGYSVSIVPLSGHVELRASYFSCHTDNKDDEIFTFKFNLIATHEGEKAAYALNKTCSPKLPWAPREVTCDVSYMEVYVRNEVTCPSGNEDQNASLKPASATSDCTSSPHGFEYKGQKRSTEFDIWPGYIKQLVHFSVLVSRCSLLAVRLALDTANTSVAMALGFFLGVALFFLSVRSVVKCAAIPDGVLHMECHDRYFMITVDLSFTGEDPRFEAIAGTGVYPISEQYAATCGYSVCLLPLQDHVALRASYFSCHTDYKDDKMFTFKFNLIATHEGEKVTYALSKTCSPTLPWSPREVTCEVNYMEVSVRSEGSCPSSAMKDDWNGLRPAHSSTTSDWQVTFQRAEEPLPPMNLSEAHKQGYAFDLTDGRLVFRTPYGQPDSLRTTVNGVPVEVVYATLFSRQSWVVLMVDLVAACSMHEGSYDDSGYMLWQTPGVLYPSLDRPQLSIGVNGELVEQPVAEERGYIVEKHNTTVQIKIPYNAEGGYRKSIVSGNLNEYYVFHLYLEQMMVDEDNLETRIRLYRTLATPLMPHPIFTENQTLLEDRTFTVYLEDVPEDVELTDVHLNGHKYTLPFNNTSSQTITKVVHPNNTCGYTLKVPFDDPIIVQEFSKEQAVLQYKLDINYTMTILPENEPYYHLESVEALFTDVSPPTFDAVCLESGIRFKLDHRPFDYMWDIGVGSDLLTSELATQHGYILSNDSQSLLLDVPLFTHGYEYKDVTLKAFFGTFEILVRDHDTSEVQSSTVKTCPFTATEVILCSTDGRMTVVADLSLAIPSGGVPARTNLVDEYCGPKEADDTKALFSFPLNGCGSTVKIDRQNVTYQNEIFFSTKYLDVNGTVSFTTERVKVQCTYSLVSLHRLFSLYKFESDKVGVGRIIHTVPPTAAWSPTIKPTTALKTTPAAKGPTGVLAAYLPAANPPARYIKVSRVKHFLSGVRKGGSSQTKIDAAKIGRTSNFKWKILNKALFL
ncbi:uncharacterized protein LOC118338448 [Morone saxatilis]|uniref:uncharacterized protein LOC118338448 n=1 Tax=Morone saxatilis TaxID=34816 RepID=UPI0015E23C82|nr:uncharacterized protein LOC118338448 [Morone saxatilis]